MKITLGWSNFAIQNSTAAMGNSFTILKNEELVDLVLSYWANRIPGAGETTTNRKVLVPVPPQFVVPAFGFQAGTPFFRCTTALLDPKMPVKARITKRKGQEEEDFHVQKYTPAVEFYAAGFEPEPANFVNIVCYHKDALTENGGTRSTKCDWEIVTILASPVENEPMGVGAMARNQLELPGGTKSEYSALQYAESVVYWGKRIRIVAE